MYIFIVFLLLLSLNKASDTVTEDSEFPIYGNVNLDEDERACLALPQALSPTPLWMWKQPSTRVF